MEQFKTKIVVLCPYCSAMYKVSVDLKGKTVTCATCQKKFIVDESATDFYEKSLNKSLLFCKIALNYGFASASQVETVLTSYTQTAQHGVPPSIEALFTQKGYLDQNSLAKINKIIPLWGLRQQEKDYAAAAVKKGLLSNERAKELLILQAKHFDATGVVKKIEDYIAESSMVQPSIESGPQKVKSDITENITPEPKIVSEPKVVATQPVTVVKVKEPEINEPEVVKEEPVKKEHEAEVKPVLPDKGEKPKDDQPQTKQPANLVSSNVGRDATPKPEAPALTPEKKPELENENSEKDEKKPPVDISAVEEELKEAANNANIPDIENFSVKIISGLEFSIHPEGIIALLKAPEGIPHGTTLDSIKFILEDEGIQQGVVDDSLIKGFLNSKVFREKPFKIAEGKPAKVGREGFIKYHFDTEHLKVGVVSESGEIDFKDRGEIPYVNKGDLLAEIKPAVIGENGVDVYGRVIGVPVIQPVGIRCEEGTEFSEDRMKVYAKCDGQPKLTIGNAIYVLSELKIPGDVGFETGHIEFEGNINISGTVQSDFRVVGASITANEVLGAEIIATGDVTVVTGITGALIKAEGDVKSKFVNRAKIKAFGNVIVEKEIIDSEIKNSGGCQVIKGKIISSEIYSRQGIEAMEIGTEMSKPSRLRIGVDDHINDEIEIVQKKISEKKEVLEMMIKEIEALTEEEKKTHAAIADLAHVQDRSQIEVNELHAKLKIFQDNKDDKGVAAALQKVDELTDAIKNADNEVGKQFDRQDELIDKITNTMDSVDVLKEELAIVKQEKKGLTEWIRKQKMVAYIKTSGAIYSGTAIIGPNSSIVLRETVKPAKIREVASPETDSGWEMKII